MSAHTTLSESFCKDLIKHALFDEAVKLVKDTYKLEVEANQSKNEFKIKADGLQLLELVGDLLASWLERKKKKMGNSIEDRIKAMKKNPLLDVSGGLEDRIKAANKNPLLDISGDLVDRIKAANKNPLLDISGGHVQWVFWGNFASELLLDMNYAKVVEKLKQLLVDIKPDKKAKLLYITCKCEVYDNVKETVENVKILVTSGQAGSDKSQKSDIKNSSQIDDSKSKGCTDGKEIETPVTDSKSASQLESAATSLVALSKMSSHTVLTKSFCQDLIKHKLFDEAVKLVKDTYKLKVEANQSNKEFMIIANGIEILELAEKLLESWLDSKKKGKGNNIDDRIKAAKENPVLDISEGCVVWVFWGNMASKVLSTEIYAKVEKLKGLLVEIKPDKKDGKLYITCNFEVFMDVKMKVEDVKRLVTSSQAGSDKSLKAESKTSSQISDSKSEGSKDKEIKGKDVQDHSTTDLPVSKPSDVCGTTMEKFTGNQPTGIMYHKVQKDIHLPGFESYGTIEIFYEFPAGIQVTEHPNPGKPYRGIKRKAFLPGNSEGRKVLQLLKVAFDRKLLFTVGNSLTTGMTDVIIWSGIEHKTKVIGGPSQYGYPDVTYLSRVQEELALICVTEKDIQDADDTPDALDRPMKVERTKEENVPSRRNQEQRRPQDKKEEFLLFDGTISVERPKYWTEMKNTEILKVVTLDISDLNYTNVVQEFHKSSGSQRPVVKVERIQNVTLYSQYIVKKRQLEIQNSHNNNERILWHGTTPDAVDSINTHGFNRSYCGKNAASYGNGVYFAVSASYSVKETYSTPDSQGHKRIYQCRVLTGDYTQGKNRMKVPPPKSPTQTHILYDSVVDKPNNPNMFIIFHDVQAYPSYLVTFK